ncbi:MAG: DUF429 domain-containing protein [Actinomycetia bacterium]|nr:DUF429 domain-containing protein [Actinomycetes bacterium]
MDGHSDPRRVAGVDGAKRGWVVAESGLHAPARVTVTVVDRLDDLVGRVADGSLAALAIDMPIALPSDGPRWCDREARALLGPRRSSLFPTPVRAVLDAVDYSDALTRSRSASGVGLSKQAWHLVPRIRELDNLVTADLARRIVEAHPESGFAVLAGAPLESTKKTPEGRAARRTLLAPRFAGLDAALDDRGGGVGVDDVLDATINAWTARRLVRGTARILADGTTDHRGRPLQLVT